MILYPFPPGSALKCGIAGFDEEKREPAAELYLLAPGAVPPAEFDGGYLFCEAPGCRDTRLLQPVQTAAPDAPDRKSTRLNSSHKVQSRMPSSA